MRASALSTNFVLCYNSTEMVLSPRPDQANDDMDEPVAIPLSPIDNVMPRIYANFILTFHLKATHAFGPVHDILQKSLAQTCEKLPVFRSKVFAIPGDKANPSTGRLAARRYEDWCPEVIYNDLSESWPEYEDLLEDGLDQDLLEGQHLLPEAEFDWDFASTGAPALVAQANYVKSGLLLAVGIFHPIIDGTSGSLLMKLWANNARALQGCGELGPALQVHPDSCDYSILSDIWAAEEKDGSATLEGASPQSWRLIGLLPPNLPASNQASLASTPPVMQTNIFYMSAEAFENLTSLCATEDTSCPHSSKVTANDALMALLWRCIIRARAEAAGPSSHAYAADSISMLDTTLDGRALIGNPLPWSYMGTVVFIATTSMQVGDLISDATGLPTIARTIRESLTSIDREKALQAFGIASNLSDYEESLRYPFATFEGAEVCITSWVGLSAFDISFGDKLFSGYGRPDLIRPPTREFDAICRRCVVLPMQASGGFEVLISLVKEEMEVLETDTEFAEYFKIVGN